MVKSQSETENRIPVPKKDSVSDRANRLKKAIEAAGGNSVVSERSGVPKSSLSNYLQGRDMKAGVLAAIADACEVSLDWLIRGEESTRAVSITCQNDAKFSEEMVFVPFLQSEASAGSGLVPLEWGTDHGVCVPVQFLRGLLGAVPKDIFFMKVRGDSMQPSIHTGDTVIIHYTQAPLRDGIYAISVNGMAMVKRLGLKNPVTYSVISDNPFYERFDVPAKGICWGNSLPDAQVRIIGRVIGCFHLELDALLP